MDMMKSRLLVSLAVAAACVWAGTTGAPPKLEYRLPVAKKLCYTRVDSRAGAATRGTEQALEVWVARANPDSSRLLVLRSVTAVFLEDSSGRHRSGPADTALGYVEMFPDGRVRPNYNYSLGNVNISRLFVPLPDADSVRRWARVDSQLGDVDSMELEGYSAQDSAWHVRIATHTRLDRAYGLSRSADVAVGAAAGLPVRVEATSASSYGRGAGTASGRTTLDSVVPLDTAAATRLAGELARFYAADSAYGELLGRVDSQPGDSALFFRRAESVLVAARAGLTEPMVQAMADGETAGFSQVTGQIRDELQWRRSKIGYLAPDWQLADLAGRNHRLKEYRGKVVVLDFWYRGCPWCIRAMPDLNALAQAYRGKPLAVLGMNVDESLSDARYVVAQLGLSYTNLRAKDVPRKYGVTGYPTLFVIGPDGVVRDIDVGYSPRLRQKLEPVITTLLPGQKHR